MKESYRKGIANHPGPEPCRCSQQAALEALDRGICRLAIELRNRALQGADVVRQNGRQHRSVRQRKRIVDPAESKTPCMYRNSMRENRETRLPPEPQPGRAGGRKR